MACLVLSRVIHKQVRELLLERRDLGPVADFNVRIVGILERVVLVIIFSAIKTLERDNLRHDPRREDLGRVQLSNIGLSDALLIRAAKENHRAIRSTNVRPLAVELSGIMGDGEEDAEKLSVGDARRIKD